MSIEKTLTVQKRNGLGKGPNRRLRSEKIIPGVFYSPKGDNVAVQMQALPLEKLYGVVGRTTVFNLEIEEEGKKSIFPVMVWDAQYHAYKKEFTHIDFYGVDLDKPVKVKVPVEYVGTSRGVKLGGRLETFREQLLLVSTPLNMPSKITVDITDLDINKTIYVADITLPEGVSAAYDSNYAMVSVISKSADEAAEDAE